MLTRQFDGNILNYECGSQTNMSEPKLAMLIGFRSEVLHHGYQYNMGVRNQRAGTTMNAYAVIRWLCRIINNLIYETNRPKPVSREIFFIKHGKI